MTVVRYCHCASCANPATSTNESPGMNAYCDECTAYRCDITFDIHESVKTAVISDNERAAMLGAIETADIDTVYAIRDRVYRRRAAAIAAEMGLDPEKAMEFALQLNEANG